MNEDKKINIDKFEDHDFELCKMKKIISTGRSYIYLVPKETKSDEAATLTFVRWVGSYYRWVLVGKKRC